LQQLIRRAGAIGAVAALLALGLVPPASAARTKDYASECASPTITLNASSDASASLHAGDVALLTGGTYTGGLNSFDEGAVVCVEDGATFQPAYINNAAGHILSQGAVTLPGLSTNTGFVLDSSGTVAIPSGINTNGAAVLVNRAGGIWNDNSEATLSAGTSFSNAGTANFRSLALNTGTSVDNAGLMRIAGSFASDGAVANTGVLITTGEVEINAPATLTNACVLRAESSIINDGSATNTGSVVIAGDLTNNADWSQTTPGITTGAGLRNDGDVTGFGQYRFTGNTENQGDFTGGSSAEPIVVDDTTPTGPIFDLSTGGVVNTVAGTVTPPDDGYAPESCATPPVPTDPSADLVVAKTGPAFVRPGDPITYTITVSNDGPDDADDVVVTDAYPANLVDPVASAPGVVGASDVTWELGTLAAGDSETLTVSGTAPATGILTDTVSGTTSTSDPEPANNDGRSPSATVRTIVIPVIPDNNPPVAPDATVTTKVDIPVNGVLQATDPDENQQLTYSIVDDPTHGRAVVRPDGVSVYLPERGFTGTDTFTYQVCDNGIPSRCDTGTVTVHVLPVARDDAASTPPGTPVTIPVRDNDRGTVSAPEITTQPDHGTVSVGSDGEVTYTPDDGFEGVDTFDYQICSPQDPTICASATVTVTVAPPTNQPPVAQDDTVTTHEGVPVSGTVEVSDPDAGQTLTVTAAGDPAHGSATVRPDGTYTYTPDPGFVGTDTFEVIVCDDGTPVLCDSATVTIRVLPPVVPPTPTPTVTPTPTPTASPTPSPTSSPAPTATPSPTPGDLATTGASVAPVAWAAGVLLVLGAAALLIRRRRS